MRISDWSSDVCSSDLTRDPEPSGSATGLGGLAAALHLVPLRHHLRLARLEGGGGAGVDHGALLLQELAVGGTGRLDHLVLLGLAGAALGDLGAVRSEEHTSELSH